MFNDFGNLIVDLLLFLETRNKEVFISVKQISCWMTWHEDTVTN